MAFMVLIVIHFYSLRKFRQALLTIHGPFTKKTKTTVDEEAVSPVVQVPAQVVYADKQGVY